MPRLTGFDGEPLVGTERAIHLDLEAAVDLHAAAVVLPGHAEDMVRSGSTMRSRMRHPVVSRRPNTARAIREPSTAWWDSARPGSSSSCAR